MIIVSIFFSSILLIFAEGFIVVRIKEHMQAD